jgi:hypothetical protein
MVFVVAVRVAIGAARLCLVADSYGPARRVRKRSTAELPLAMSASAKSGCLASASISARLYVKLPTLIEHRWRSMGVILRTFRTSARRGACSETDTPDPGWLHSSCANALKSITQLTPHLPPL